MFGIGKLIETIVVIAMVWFGFKYIQRIGEMNDRRRQRAGQGQRASAATPPGIEDMICCRECGTWQSSRDAKACGRRGYPY